MIYGSINLNTFNQCGPVSPLSTSQNSDKEFLLATTLLKNKLIYDFLYFYSDCSSLAYKQKHTICLNFGTKKASEQTFQTGII